MPFSFAQNFEDVLLWRCFHEKRNGFYVDVGASSPIIDNVTHVFYERGWSGLNIDPIPERAAELRRLRPRDTTLCIAVGGSAGTATILRQPGVGGLSTLTDMITPELSEYTKGAWHIEAVVKSLSSIFADEKVCEIDFLKIDVEGSETAVLGGLNLTQWRPALILVEATLPMSVIPSHAAWEVDLLARGYTFCWFDGLNRYYLAQERVELASHFVTPPNVHDAMPRFGGLGRALLNSSHPDHAFAAHFATLLLRAPGIETDEYLEEVMRKDLPPALFEGPIDAEGANTLYLLVLARRPDPVGLEKLLTRPPTGNELLRTLITSHEFRVRRSRISG